MLIHGVWFCLFFVVCLCVPVKSVCLEPGCEIPAGVIQRFTLIVDETRQHGKLTITANGTTPGPTLFVQENDLVIVTVINQLVNRNTTIHWHGIFQYSTPFFDGAVGVTQCAIPATQTMTYQFRALPSGTAWYHGHVDGQLIAGLYGALVITNADDVAASKHYGYGNKEWIWSISDWYRDPVSYLRSQYLSPMNVQGMEPVPDGIQLNQYRYAKQEDGPMQMNMNIPRYHVGINDTIRIRLINAAAMSMYSFSIDGLALTVIEVDGIAVSPLSVSSVMLDAGQRISVIVNMSELSQALPQSWAHALMTQLYPSIYARIESVTSMWGVDVDTYRPHYNAAWNYDPIMMVILSTDPTASNTTLPNYNASLIKPQPGVNVIMAMSFAETGPMSMSDMEMMASMGIDENWMAARPLHVLSAPSSAHELYLEITKPINAQGIYRYAINRMTFMAEDNPSYIPPTLYSLITQAYKGTTNMSMPPMPSGSSSSSSSSTGAGMPNHGGHLSTPMISMTSHGGTSPPHDMSGTTAMPGGGHGGHGGSNATSPSVNRTLIVSDQFDIPFNTVVDIFINNTDAVSHPMHLHGYHFWVVSSSSLPSADTLYGPNYIRRDTAVVPGNGWLRIRLRSTNPGLWLLHCHMEWHMMAGLSTMISTGLNHLPHLINSTLPSRSYMEPCMNTAAQNWVFANSSLPGTGMTGGHDGMPGMSTGDAGGGHNAHGAACSSTSINTIVLSTTLVILTIITCKYL